MFENIMASIYNAFASVRDREEGQALVEYALILSLVSVAAIATLGPLGGAVSGIFTGITASL
jgi:pilus assembly protein Flp/PilA